MLFTEFIQVLLERYIIDGEIKDELEIKGRVINKHISTLCYADIFPPDNDGDVLTVYGWWFPGDNKSDLQNYFDYWVNESGEVTLENRSRDIENMRVYYEEDSFVVY